MSVSTFGTINFNQPNTGSPFPTLNGDLSVLARLSAAFAPHETMPPSMRVAVDAGALFAAGALVEIPAQISTEIVPPSANARIDRVVLDRISGALSIVTGIEAANPVPPAIPASQAPVAQIRLNVGTTAIVNALMVDERIALGGGGQGLLGIQQFTGNGTYTPTPGTASVVVEVIGGGGGGGGCAAPSASQGAAGGGGSSGSYARARFTSGFVGAAITVGAGGAATSSGSPRGNPGDASSFGALVTAPGGRGGYTGIAFVPNAVVGGSEPAAAATGGNLLNTAGNPGGPGIVLSATAVLGGNGGSSPFGGAGSAGGNQPGGAGTAPGAGGGGASSIASAGARLGGAGSNGLVTIYEYSA